MPILDHSKPVDWYYNQSPFLFWSVIGVAYRTYSPDRVLFNSLAAKITERAYASLNPIHASLCTVKGLLLLLNWPFPSSSLGQDIHFSLCGGMLHMAMQIGLHVPLSSQDFTRVRIRLKDEDIKDRAELWAHCVLVYER